MAQILFSSRLAKDRHSTIGSLLLITLLVTPGTGLAEHPYLIQITGDHPTSQDADSLPTLAVFDLRDGGSFGAGAEDLVNLGTGLSAMLTTEMSRNPAIQMVERTQLVDLIEEITLQRTGLVEEATAIEVGKLAGAQYMLLGTFTDINSVLRIDIRIVHVETGRLIRAEESTHPRAEVFAMVSELAERAFEELSLPPPEPGRVEPVPANAAQAAVHFSRGLVFEDRRELERARTEYRRALEIYPGFAGAAEGLQRLGGNQ